MLEEKNNTNQHINEDQAERIVTGIAQLLGQLLPDTSKGEKVGDYALMPADEEYMRKVYSANPHFASLSAPLIVAASKVRCFWFV